VMRRRKNQESKKMDYLGTSLSSRLYFCLVYRKPC
jgi:hypothetical protein